MAKIRLGVVDQCPVRNGGSAEDAIRETLELAVLTERLGYTRYWLAEHHSTNSFAGAAPEVLIPQVAALTSRMRVGSGGVMLSHYSPLKVAEQFRMLEALHPGRIDLGIGRAPGGDRRATEALAYGRGSFGIETFPRQIADLLAWVNDEVAGDHPFGKVRAMPRISSAPEVWLLGSGGASGDYAAQYGCGYSFAQFISGLDGSDLVRRYRAAFRASRRMPVPRASVGIGVICAPTDAEAQRLGLSLELWRGRVARGVDRGIPSPEQAEEEFRSAGIPLDAFAADPRVVKGSPQRVREELVELAGRYGVDELMVVTVTYGFADRVRSYELLAEVMELEPAG